MAANDIFIAKRKGARSHVFIRAYKRGALEAADCSLAPESLDQLLLAQSPESFVYAVAAFLPLSPEPLCKAEVSRWPRLMTVRQYAKRRKALFEPIDEAVLLEECTGLKDGGSELNKSSLHRAAITFDAERDGSFDQYVSDNAFDDDDVVVIEPVLDWAAARALASNMVLFQALLENSKVTPDSAGPGPYGNWLEKGAGDRIRQFSYNPAWRSRESLGKYALDGLLGGSDADGAPWLAGYFDFSASSQDGPNGGVKLKGSDYVRFKGAASISGEKLPFTSKARKQVIDRSLYLVADPAPDVRQLARDFMGAVLTATQERTSLNGKPLGWSFDYGSAAEQPAAPSVVFHSQGARLLYEAAFHGPEFMSAVCKNCGRPMLNRAGSKPRQFCSASCKTTYSNAQREAEK